MEKVTRIETIGLDQAGLHLTLDLGRMQVVAPRPGILRLRMTFEAGGYLPSVEPGMDVTDPAILEQWSADGGLDFKIGETTLRFSSEPFGFAIRQGEAVCVQTLPGRAFWKDRLGRLWHYLTKDDADFYFGLGEKSGGLLRNDRRFRMNSVDAIGYDPEFGDPLYKHIPFFMKTNADTGQTIGVYLNNAYPSQFDFGSERSGYWGPYTSIGTDGGDLDLFFLLGPTPQAVLHQYHQVAGFAPLPTKASLGYMGSTMYYTELEHDADQAVLGFIERCQALDIPISGFHLSSGYTKRDDGKRYVFTWNKDRFPDPQGFVDAMHAADQVLSPNIKPGMLTTHPLWDEFDQAGAFIKAPDGKSSHIEKFWGGRASFVDFSNPAGRALWNKHLAAALLDLGIPSIWNDNNEFEIDEDEAVCDNDGRPVPAQAMRPVMPNLMAEIAFEALVERGVRPFVLSRAGFSGLQKYAQTWSGDNGSDWRNFHFNLATMLGMSLSGVPFNGMDIGGFAGPAPEPELFLRWVQNGIFHPRFSIHSVNSDNTVTEPWLYPALTGLIRVAIKTRYLFLPTLYTIAADAAESGRPIVAPLFYFWPEERAVRTIHTQFMLGESLMAVALTEPGLETISVRFPPGRWRCFYTEQWFEGETTAEIPLVDAYSPLFLRAGTGVTLDTNFTKAIPAWGSFEPDSLIIRILAVENGRMRIYDDDGATLRYKNGDYFSGELIWTVDASSAAFSFERKGERSAPWRTLIFEIDVDHICPREIALDGESLSQTLYEDRLEIGRWYFDVTLKRVRLQLPGDVLERPFELHMLFEEMMTIFEENEPTED